MRETLAAEAWPSASKVLAGAAGRGCAVLPGNVLRACAQVGNDMAGGNVVAYGDPDGGDGSGHGRRDVQRGLVRLQGDQRILVADHIAAVTCTSITGTSMKWPISGTATLMTSSMLLGEP